MGAQNFLKYLKRIQGTNTHTYTHAHRCMHAHACTRCWLSLKLRLFLHISNIIFLCMLSVFPLLRNIQTISSVKSQLQHLLNKLDLHMFGYNESIIPHSEPKTVFPNCCTEKQNFILLLNSVRFSTIFLHLFGTFHKLSHSLDIYVYHVFMICKSFIVLMF